MTDISYHIDDFYAVIVLYKYSLDHSPTIQSLNRSLQSAGLRLDVMVYDNNPRNTAAETTLSSGQLNITYIYDPSNPGIGKAYNTGAARAERSAKKWILLLDEDTVLPENGIRTYIDAVNTDRSKQLFAPILRAGTTIISPSRYKWKRGFPVKHISPGVYSLRTHSPINSGLLVNADLFKLSGGYHPEIKLDFSDFFFIDKLKKHISNFVVIDLVMEHSLSGIADKSKFDAMLNRFVYYCKGAKYSAREDMKSYPVFFLIVLLRALKLSFTLKSFRFMGVFFKHFLS